LSANEKRVKPNYNVAQSELSGGEQRPTDKMLATEWGVLKTCVDTTTFSENEEEDSVSKTRLQLLKMRVPEFIHTHGRRAWDSAVSATTRIKPVFTEQPPHVINRAFFKMREMTLSCSIHPPLCSLHLGEAPGGFVQATAQFAKPDWRWCAVSLEGGAAIQPMTEHLPEGGCFLSNLPGHGDMLVDECRVAITERVGWECDLVTADGALEMDHNNLEQSHLELLFFQTDVAMANLKTGGTFLCKFFEGNLYRTKLWIALLSERFEYTCIIKPAWSRPTNSERYIVCKQFCGNKEPLERKGRVALPWLHEVAKILDRLCDEQSRALEKALARSGVRTNQT
jgi:23S rRNA U2552 (ribose-2'-O)-methylase RlmE/FtsJ